MKRRDFLLAAASAAAPGKSAQHHYLNASRQFLDTLIDKGTDQYGKRHTPLFCLVLDPETHSPPRAPDRIDATYARSFEYLFRDFGYYWKSHLHSANLIYDMGTMRALYAMPERKYHRAADSYLDFFLENMVSQQTGHFGWGEHIFWNVFLDYLIGGGFTVRGSRNFLFCHELERWTTIYDLTWEKSPEKTAAEIEAIYEYKILDHTTFLNNRHSDYFEGRRTSDVFTFVKHSGLFAHAFSFLYSKTGDAKHLKWAVKMCDLFWDHRHPQTGLVRNSLQRAEEPADAAGMAQLALFLMRAYQWTPQEVFLERALAYLKSYWKHFRTAGGFRDSVDLEGRDLKPGQLAPYWEGPIRQAKSAALAYCLTRDPMMLELADTVITHVTAETPVTSVVIRSLVSDAIEARSCALSAAIDLYESTGERKYLAKAQQLADDAIARFLYRGLFVSWMQLQPEGDKNLRARIYDARTGAGWLALNLIRLQRDVDATHAGTFRKFDTAERIYD